MRKEDHKKFKTGDILLLHIPFRWYDLRSYLSWAIRFFTSSHWNHTAVLYKLDHVILVVEAMSKGVVATEFERWKKDHKDYSYEIYRTHQVEPKLTLEISFGKKYDFWSTLFYQVFYVLTGRWFGPIGKQSEKKVNCSELAALYLKIPNAYAANPEKIYQYLVENSAELIACEEKTT
jgi:hypothetical protein